MTDTDNTAFTANSITVFRSLISELDVGHFAEAQLYDLSALASESAEGLCQGLLCLSEGLENCETLPPEGIAQVSGYLKASAHLIPALFELCEKANNSMTKTRQLTAYPMN
ncbi:hypothetical protein AB6869_20145 [Rahnella rivi]|uniref:hypothetical protein n=1 Tax=Rahnella rivi TaxID=2816249 RepID=UPI0039BE391B